MFASGQQESVPRTSANVRYWRLPPSGGRSLTDCPQSEAVIHRPCSPPETSPQLIGSLKSASDPNPTSPCA